MPRLLAVCLAQLFLCCGSLVFLSAEQQVAMAKRGNIRFGPSTDAPVVTTLNPGTTVTVLGKAPGRDGWYQIRFPRQGFGWMHGVVLAETTDPRVLRVTQDKASVRSDARIKSELVDQLSLGETVELIGFEVDGVWKPRKVGQWHAVYPPNAVAYVYQSVLALGQPTVAAIQKQQVAGLAVESSWQQAQVTYRDFREQLQRDPNAALGLDWHQLATDLAAVVENHPTFRTRLMAKKMYAGIQRLMSAVQRARTQQGLPPMAALPDVPDPVAAPEPVAVAPAAQPQPADPFALPPQEPAPVAPAAQPAVVEPPASLPDANAVLAAAAAGSDAIEGWLVQKDVIGVDSKQVLLNENSEVAAIVVANGDLAAELSEMFWRRVAVSGKTSTQTVSVDGIGQSLPVIQATDVRLVR